jgi:glycosyltransferase involved in cell wall biosynthesis
MKIGIVTPSLNAERYLDLTLKSIWSQQSDDLEIDHVVADGGSVDRTREVASRYPSRVFVEADTGMYDALNRGMQLVEGEVVGYINSDDEIAPGALDAVINAFRTRPDVQWVCGAVEYIDGQGALLARMTPVHPTLRAYAALGWSCIPQQTVWTRRKFFDTVGPFDSSYRICGDYDWYARALRLASPLILRQTLGRFRWHGGNLSYDPRMIEESRWIRERWGDDGVMSYLHARILSLRINLRNPGWLLAKKTGRLRFRR